MADIIIVIILAAALTYGVKETVKHFKGQGACCGGGGTVREKTKVLENPVIAKKIFKIEGMHCENCKNSIERSLNLIDGVSCTVSLRKKTAAVSYDREINDDKIKETIEKLGFRVSEK